MPSATTGCCRSAHRRHWPNYIARKGSITVNGTSLTTNDVEGTDFTINLIPHTLQNTMPARAGREGQPRSRSHRYCERPLNPEL